MFYLESLHSNPFSTHHASSSALSAQHKPFLSFFTYSLQSVYMLARSYGMTALKPQFGHRNKDLREQRGWPQKECALVMSAGKTNLGNIGFGKRNPALGNIEKIARGFGISRVSS
ncbi:helix-turn-helix domain-containing protein [Gordonibacter sp. An230]|uniref:helix-turn-helix domain-containing protein n=1 Tax=Gordonibacter sp. An230 TaxID=1965592 RepID=UPI001122DE6D|nr:helix-turn-helix transcriptional regulator [Gordonibacter sp. An230]